MFDIGWSELMILGIIALIVVGPKELPGLLRTIGRYSGMLRKQAAEFRAHFDEAMREAELDQIKKDVTSIKDDITGAVSETTRALTDELDSAKRQLEFPELDDPDAHDANGMPIHKPRPKTVEEAAAAVAAEEKAKLGHVEIQAASAEAVNGSAAGHAPAADGPDAPALVASAPVSGESSTAKSGAAT